MQKATVTLSLQPDVSPFRLNRNQLLDTLRAPKKRAASASPAPLESECWFLSPLKCKGLRDCSPPALHAPPLSFSLPQKEPYSKDSISGLSPYRSKQDRVKAIHSLCKELAEKIEMATKRLSGASTVKDSADKTSRETTLDLFNESSSIPEPETSKDEQDRTMTIQMLLDTPDPDVLHVSSGRGFNGLGRISLAGSTEGATALDRQKEKPTPLAGGSEELPWITHSAGLRHLNTRKDLSNTLQGSSHGQNATDATAQVFSKLQSPISPWLLQVWCPGKSLSSGASRLCLYCSEGAVAAALSVCGFVLCTAHKSNAESQHRHWGVAATPYAVH